jgi:FixJ family two-component response regulator
MTLAIVDDDDDVRRALARLLRSLGHDVRTFASAEELEKQIAAVECAIVTKPFDDAALMAAIDQAIIASTMTCGERHAS